MANGRIKKSTWLMATECATQAWLSMRERLDSPNEAERFRMEQGQEIGRLARELYPDGVFVVEGHREDQAITTRRVLQDTGTTALFEAEFRHASFVARADILTREDDGWHLLEVKSSFADTDALDELVDDLAYTVMVARATGLSVLRSSLVLLSREYRHGDEVSALFEVVDQTEAVNALLTDATERLAHVEASLLSGKRPDARLVRACRYCPFFEEKCLGAGIKHSIFELPRLHPTKLNLLSAAGIVALEDVPEDFSLTDSQARARECALSGKILVSPELTDALSGMVMPFHYLDFETVTTFLPLYEGRGCHEQVLTQFSAHHCGVPGQLIGHDEFLADPVRDCERELAERLISVLGDRGSIMVYSAFEKTRMKALAKRFPDLAGSLESAVERFVDLYELISRHVYHPDFKGSFSIKMVLPALVPTLSYEGLEIGDGGAAIMRLARMARGEMPTDQIERTRQALLEYCRLDTLAMVRLHERLCSFFHDERRGSRQ